MDECASRKKCSNLENAEPNLTGIWIRISTETFSTGTELQCLLSELNNFKNDGKRFLTVSFYWHWHSYDHES